MTVEKTKFQCIKIKKLINWLSVNEENRVGARVFINK
jgi:hypothetical protein